MLKRNIKLVFTTNAVMLCSGVITSILSARALGPAGRGDLTVVLMWPSICAMVGEIGLPQAYRFWTAKRPESISAMFSNAVIFTLVVGLLALGLSEILIPYLIGERSPGVLKFSRIYLLVIPALMLTELIRGLLEGARHFSWVGASRVVFFGIQCGATVLLFLTNRLTVASATYILIISIVASLLVSLFAVWRKLRPNWQPQVSQLGTTLRYGVRAYPGVLTEYVNWRLDLVVLVGIAASSEIGLYVAALSLAAITTTLASSVSDALMPEVAASEPERATYILTKSLRLTLLGHLLLLIPLWVAAPSILRLAYGESFVPVTNVWRLLMIASVVWSLGAVVISGLNGFGYPGLSTISRFTAACVMAVALLVFLPVWGIQGAALAAITGSSVMFLVALFWLLRQRRISLWECMRPRWEDITTFKFADFGASFKLQALISRTGTPTPAKLVTGIEKVEVQS
jgi:O-antigen/teichoic acid export membrane protein